jgi:ubiquinone/menaquinone biosynthesis C-methylase UbiE
VTLPDSASSSGRSHYSYTHYADPAVAEGFDALRFSGPIGKYLADTQREFLAQALAPLDGRVVLDVGTGTARSAIGLAAAGARVIGLDASADMLRVARGRLASAGASAALGVADAHHLPLPDLSVDAAISLRVLMHAIDWRACVSELCRVTRRRVIVDFPALASAAAIESTTRKVVHALGGKVEPYTVLAERDVIDAFRHHGFRVITIRREFVLPIAVHKAIGTLAFTRSAERVLAAAGLRRLFGSPVTVVAER